MWKCLHIFDVFCDIFDDFAKVRIGFHHLFGLADCIDDGGMVSSAKFFADGGHAHLGDIFYYIHCNLAGAAYICGAFVALNILFGDIEGSGGLAYDFADGHRNGLAVVENIADSGLGHHNGNGFVFINKGVCLDVFNCAFKLADIAFKVVCDKIKLQQASSLLFSIIPQICKFSSGMGIVVNLFCRR